MWNDEDVIIISAAFLIISRNERRQARRQRRFWIRPSLRKRNLYSGSDLLTDLCTDDLNPLHNEIRSTFKNFLKMSSADFESLLQMIGPRICQSDFLFYHCIPNLF